MEKLDGKTLDLVQQNINELKKMFPEATTEGKIDFDKLRLLLGDEVETGKERYEFTWPGKGECIRLSQQQSTGTLRPDKESSKDWDSTKNLYIEGDNLEVLRLLQKAYHRKVKMIYIDPPYNTGNDFVYKDDFKDNVQNYKTKTEQDMMAKPANSGRYHSDWINMMYSRLRLAKNLLTDDGAIFISIDDKEMKNLKMICDDIFGEENFVAQFPWRKRTAKSDVPFGVSQDYEWIFCYAKSNGFVASIEGAERKYFETPDLPNRPWRIHDLTSQRSASERPNSFFTLINPITGVTYPASTKRTWAITTDTFQQYYDDKRIVFPGDYNFLKITKPTFRYFKDEDEAKAGDLFGYTPVSTNFPKEIGMTQDGTKDIESIFQSKVFGFPKPVSLIKFLIKIATALHEDALILDFFSGSATTGHAVMQLNAEDEGGRQFIMVQLPETCDEKSEAFNAGYRNICDIGKERIRRAGEKIREEYQDKEGIDNLDIGFRVFKLDTSNLKAWDTEVQELEASFKEMVDPIKEDRTQEDMLFEIMLKYGIDLTMPIEEIQVKGKKTYSIGLGYMLVCLEDGLTIDVIEAIGAMKQAGQEIARVVFRDSGFADDNVKTNAVQLLKKFGIEDFRAI